MKKLYKVKKSFGSYAEGTGFEADDGHESTKGLLAAGLIEEDPGAADSLIAKAVASLTVAFAAAIGPAMESVAARTIEAVTASVKAAAPRIEAGSSQEDKVKSLGHQLSLIGILCDPNQPPAVREHATNVNKNLYGSDYRPWDSKTATVYAKASGTMIESSGPDGGYGVFPEYATEIYRLAMEQTLLAARARKRPMTTNELRYPKLDQTSTQATGQPGILGGVVAGWANETKPGNQTQAKLKQGVLKTGELVGYTVISNELLADNGVGLEALLSDLFVEAIAWYTDYATLVGDGVDKPIGVNNANCTIGIDRGTANEFLYADAVSMISKLLPQSLRTAFWVFNQTVMPQLFQMQDGSGRNIWLANYPGGQDGPVAGRGNADRFLGLPYFFTEKTPALGSTGDVLLIDPMGYMIGERMGLEVAASPHVNFLNREMTYRFVARIAGQPLLDKAYTMVDGSHTLSTFVSLDVHT